MATDLRDAISRLLEASGVSLPGDLDEDAPWIESGLLDSTALFNLALWVEERVAPGLDLTTFDLAAEWGTLRKLLRFIERHRGAQ